MGGQNYGPFWGTLNKKVPYYNRDPKRDPNFDNYPYDFGGFGSGLGLKVFGFGFQGLGFSV